MDINKTKRALSFLSNSFINSGTRISKNEKIALNVIIDFYNDVSEDTFDNNSIANKLIIHLFDQLVQLQTSDTFIKWDNGEITVDKGLKTIDKDFIKMFVVDKIDMVLRQSEEALIKKAYDLIYFKNLETIISENKLTKESLIGLDNDFPYDNFKQVIKDISNQLVILNK